MSILFNADEALAMAEQIERNGAKFYARAAEIVEAEAVKKLLGDLAEWEEGHEKLFTFFRCKFIADRVSGSGLEPEFFWLACRVVNQLTARNGDYVILTPLKDFNRAAT